jgi:hypothetical protein
MGLHPYCLVPPGCPPPGNGIAGARVTALDGPELVAWASGHDAPPPATPENLRSHDRVVRAALDAGVTPVPFRFGQWHADAADLVAGIVARAQHWQQLLQRLAGSAEMGVRLRLAAAPAVDPPPAPSPTNGEGPGRRYLERRSRELHAAAARASAHQEVLELLAGALSGCVLQTRAEAVPDGAGHLGLAHLVHRAQVSTYGESLADLRRRRPDLDLLVTGPWPPYSFAE